MVLRAIAGVGLGQITAALGYTPVNKAGDTMSGTLVTPSVIPTANASGSLGAASDGWTKLYIDYTNTATVGAVTINKAAGRVNIAAAGTTVTVTNSLCTANAHIFCNVANNDTTASSAHATAAAGSFTITLNTAATAQIAVDFFIVSAD
jgi:hypothetical protein